MFGERAVVSSMSLDSLSPVPIARCAARYLADLLARLLAGARRLAPAAIGFALGCQAADSRELPPAPHKVETTPATSGSAAVAPAPTSEDPRELGRFTITFYYTIGEDEVVAKTTRRAPANDNQVGAAAASDGHDGEELAAIAPDQVTLYTDDCSPIADVSREFSQQLALQGSGKLRDGRVVNIWGRCKCEHSPCFRATANQWGNAGTGRPLQPFRTVAVDPKIVKLGTLLYVPLLEGRTMPGRAPWGGYVHDGCVVADDTGGFGGQKLDLFVGRKGYFFALGMSGSQTKHAWAKHVPVYDGSKLCERTGQHVGRKAAAI